MSSISNRFYITALADGTTIHGNLASTKSLTQSWNGTSASPDWTDTTPGQPNPESPTIYLILLSGSEYVQPTGTYTWYYNDVAIEDGNSLFEKIPNYQWQNDKPTMPALHIKGNLASSGNTDVDTIRFAGNLDVNGSLVSFSASIQIRISEIKAGSNFGVINFVGGKSNITEKGETLTMYGKLYDSNGKSTSCATEWYFNESATATGGSPITVDEVIYENAYQVFEKNPLYPERSVVDHAVVKCVFKVNGDIKYTAYAFIDDLQDEEFLYIQYNGGTGNAASLRAGDSATFTMWVGKENDPEVLGGASTPEYNSIAIKLLDGDANEIGGSVDNIPAPSADGWRYLEMVSGKASCTISYGTVNGVGKKNITGIVKAESTQTQQS